jgi:metallo-beta-lactamase class B
MRALRGSPTLRPLFARSRFSAVSVLLTLLAGASTLHAQTAVPAVARDVAAAERHVAAAKAAAGTQWDGLFGVLCKPPAPAPAAAGLSVAPPALPTTPAVPPAALPAAPAVPAVPGAAASSDEKPLAEKPLAEKPPAEKPSDPPERSKWYAEPAKVFDNLYYVGMTEYSAWAVTTSAGIILIDTLYDYSVEAEVVDGLSKLGLDPKTIKYAIVSHGHADHSGGAKYLQDTFGTKIVLSADDWDLVERSKGSKPRRDVVATDGMKLTLGDTTLRLYITPGHTLGTVSTVIPVRDQGRSHTAVTWGGTAFNWLGNRADYITPERPDSFWFQCYIRSATRLAEVAAQAKADVLLSNHTIFDGSKTKLPLLRTRGPGQPHPYVVGGKSVREYLAVARECAQAGLARLPKP